jgi:tyrosyl-tRNA synthetase
MKNIFNLLKSRGLIDNATSEDLEKVLVEKPCRLYLGFDPTADSLHLGNLMGMVVLSWFHKYGHEPVALVGGATGMVGDPSGKSVERNLLDEVTLERNIEGISRSLKAVLKTEVPIVNNYRWFEGITFIEFIRDIGKHFRMGTLLSKESVKSRLNSEAGLSFTEFSYQLLQAYDFLYLYDHEKITLQIGGSDQWGNIVGGTELVRKVRSESVHGLTFPLLTRSDGKKFGKSEEGTIWLNSDRLPPYDFYQYLYKVPDADVINLLKKLTFIELEEIEQIEKNMRESSYCPNSAQKRLAEEVTRLVHGEAGLEEAERITQAAKPGAATQLDLKTLRALAEELPSITLPENELVAVKLLEVLSKTPYVTSKSEARRLFSGGGVYLNNKKLDDENYIIQNEDLVEGECLLLGIGKKKKIVVSKEKI